MEEQNKQRAEAVYKVLCEMLDRHEVHYEKCEEDLLVKFGMSGDDLPMQFLMLVDKERSLLRLLSPLSFAVQEDKRLDTALAINALNNRLPEGNFDYDIASGRICFRIASCFEDCEIASTVPEYLLFLASVVVDKYNDKFLMFSKGAISLEQLLSTETE